MSPSFLHRILRLAKAATAISLASAPFVAFSMPAFAAYSERTPRYEWWLRTLHVTNAWQSGIGGGITVAVLSDGVAGGQRYLPALITGPDFTRSGRGPDSRYFGVTGTSLASLIIGQGRAGTRPVAGVAPGAKLLSIRVTLSPGDPRWSDNRVTGGLPNAIAAGIRYAVDHGATVIDLPADPGVRYPSIASGSPAAAGGSPSERAAVRYAEHKGALLVAPAGDNARSGDSVNYPAAYPGVIAVGAFGPTFVKAPYSSHQSYVTLTAAGQNVVAASRSGFRALNSTTAASAIVAGIAALIRSEFPNLTASQVRTAMTESTVFGRKGGTTTGSGYGTVDAGRAVTAAATMSPPHARAAMLGAVPRTRPVAPAVRSLGSVIARDLTGDAGVSAAVLALLLIPITLYGTMVRRRDRKNALLAIERRQHALTRPGHGTMLADPLLEFFGPQHARPAEPANTRPIHVPRFQPRPGLTGRSTLSAPLTAPPPMPSPMPTAPARNGQAQPTPGRTPAPAPTPLPAPSARLVNGVARGRQDSGVVAPDSTLRRVPVSGSPPWEPAKEPTSDLPWTVIATPPGTVKSSTGDTPAIPPPPDSVWDSAPARRSSAPRSLFEPAPIPPATSRRQPGGTDQLGGTSGPDLRQPGPSHQGTGRPAASQPGQPTSWQDLPGFGNAPAGAEVDRGPVFTWSPTEVTDQFAAVDPASPNRPRRLDRG